MYTSIDDFESLYATIQSHAAAAAGAQTVMLLVPPELDAVCACKLLVSQLRIDFVAHRILPVSSYSDIRLACADLPSLPDVTSVVLINCGGMLPVTDFLTTREHDEDAAGDGQVGLLPNQRIYVIESRRPLNLDNLFASEYVFVVDADGHVERELQDERDAYVAMLGVDDGDDEDDDEDDDDNDDADDEEDLVVDDDELAPSDDGGFGSDPDASSSRRTRRRRKRPRTHSPSGGTGASDNDQANDATLVDDDASDTDDGDDDDDVASSHGPDAGGPKSPIFEPPPNQENKENLGAFSTAALASHLPDAPAHGSPTRSRSRFATLDSASSDSEPDAPADVAAAAPSRKRPRPHPSSPPRDALARARSKRMARHRARALLFNYYGQGTWLGTSAALTVYRLVSQLGRATPEAAWVAAVGVTAQVLAEGISLARYDAHMGELDAAIAHLVADTPAATAGGGGGSGGVHRAQTDWRLPLYRHWSLMQALTTARGPAARLATWTEPGVSRIRYLFAKLGVPLDEYSKPWVHMDKRARGVVQADLAREAPTIGLDPGQLQWKGVTRTTASGSVVSAADVVEAVAAIAVYPGLVSLSSSASSSLVTATSIGSGDLDASSGIPAAAMTTQGMLTGIGPDAFYAMMAALGNDAHVARGLEAAKLLLPEIMRVAGTLITRRAIKTLRGLRYVLVRDVGDALGALRTPWGVKQLALALGSALREVNRVDLPLVVGVLQPRTDEARQANEQDDDEPEVYLLVGHAPAAEEGLVKRNKVGLAFQYAAADVQARVAQEWFDPSVLWIDKEDVTDFLEVLQGRLAAPE